MRSGLVMLVSALLASSAAAAAESRTIDSQAGPLRVETFAEGLDHPWGIAFLPDGRMLVTERPGRLRIVSPDGKLSAPLSGVPKVYATGQGGLLDVALAPDFAESKLVYVCYAEAGRGGASTAASRGRLSDTGLEDVQLIFRQEPKVDGPNHFGCRLAFAPDGMLFITLGERFKFQPAQDLASDLGKVVRIKPDGAIPPTTRSPRRAGRGRRSGPTAIATCRVPPSIRKAGSCGSASSARGAETR